MYRIRRFGILKTATVVALIYMVIVAIFAIPFALLVIVAGSSQGAFGQTTAIGAVTLAFVAIVVYGILGWIFTAIACALYNLVAGWTGGIEVQVEPVAPPPLPPAWAPRPDPRRRRPPRRRRRRPPRIPSLAADRLTAARGRASLSACDPSIEYAPSRSSPCSRSRRARASRSRCSPIPGRSSTRPSPRPSGRRASGST